MPIEIGAWNLASQYKQNPADADRNYKGRTLIVPGLVSDITLRNGNEVLVSLVNPPPAAAPGIKILCAMKADSGREAWRLSRGQSVRIRGVCDGTSALFVNLSECTIEEQPGPDPSAQLQAAPFCREVEKDPEAASKKYEDKQITMLSFVVLSKDGNSLVLTSPLKGKITVKATFPPDLKSQLDNVKVGSRVTVKGEFGSVTDDEVSVNRCWLVP